MIHNLLDKLSFICRGKIVPDLNLQIRYLIPLFLLFFVDASQSKALGDQVYDRESLPLNFGSLQVASQIWSEPVILFQAGNTGEIHAPFVISDTFGNVHVFWTVVSKNQGDFDMIYYARLDAKGWTTPVDIIASSTARAARATVGQDNFIHVIWNGPGGVFYSRAPIQGAEFVKNWTKSVLITEANIHASIATSPSGNIYIAYPGVDNSGVFQQTLEANNLYWSLPRTISPSSLLNTSSDYVEIEVSSDDTMHVVWTEFYLPNAWPPRGVFYSRSNDAGLSWSAPVLLAGDNFDQINVAVLDDNNIHVVWNGMVGIGGRYHRWSADGGQTWSGIVDAIPTGMGGTEGPAQIVGDQSGTMHMLTTYDDCAWYTYLKNQIWANPVCISGEKALASKWIEEPALAISEGNKLHAVFWDDRKRLWYATMVTDAAWIAPNPIEDELIQPSPTLINNLLATPVAEPTSWLVDQHLDVPSRFKLTNGQILIISLSPAFLLIISVVVSRFYKRVG